jgi:hypothetical protein
MKRIRRSIWWKKSYLWITLVFFLGSLSLHWVFGWKAFCNEEKEHGQQPQVNAYVTEMMRDTMENWQSEFLQLMWQVGGLAMFLYVGSPTSREGDERKEEKIDYILSKVDPQHYQEKIREWDKKYPRE